MLAQEIVTAMQFGPPWDRTAASASQTAISVYRNRIGILSCLQPSVIQFQRKLNLS
jgi:hypothetical protein